MPPSDKKGLRQRKSKLKDDADSSSSSKSKSKSKNRSFDGIEYAGIFIAIVIVILYRETLIYYVQDFMGLYDADKAMYAAVNSNYTAEISTDVEKRDAVVRAFKHAWSAYERDAMGSDEYHPISQQGSNLTSGGGIGYTVVDTLDSLLLMGLKEEYQRARKWVEEKLDFDREGNFSLFECTIRILGGLLSAYHLSGEDELYLNKAIELADRMLPVFDTPSGLPFPSINLAQRKGVDTSEFAGTVSTAEATTLQLEFRYLSYLTDNYVYWGKVENIMKHVKANVLGHGLASVFMSFLTGEFLPSPIRLGSRADSHWEYLLKQYIQTGRTEPVYKEMYTNAMNAVHEYLISKSQKAFLTHTSELHPQNGMEWKKVPRQDHLVCFFGGNLLLGAVSTTQSSAGKVSIPPRPGQLTDQAQRDWKTGVELIRTCVLTHDTATGLAPEVVYFRIPSDPYDQVSYMPSDWYIPGAGPGLPVPYEARYLLRPETLESLYIAFRLTGDHKYRRWAWDIFQAIEKHCKVATGGYASIINVDDRRVPVEQENKMESFMLSETLKYLYLIFSDDTVWPLDKYVLNTEAHPLPIFEPKTPTGFL